jgi:hypothetical protein
MNEDSPELQAETAALKFEAAMSGPCSVCGNVPQLNGRSIEHCDHVSFESSLCKLILRSNM